jgi:hypothetical protein
MSTSAPVVSGTRTDPEQYVGFELMPIAGTWRQGREKQSGYEGFGVWALDEFTTERRNTIQEQALRYLF